MLGLMEKFKDDKGVKGPGSIHAPLIISLVDARRLSCPQPVLLTLKEIKKINRGGIVVLVDTDTSRENVSRAATSQGWSLKGVEPDGTGYRISLSED